MRELLLRIRKKTTVPTKHQIVHQYRSDWITVGAISYEQTRQMLKSINGLGPIENEAQFAFWIFKNYGPGTYSLLAFKKGYKGFYSFLKMVCEEQGYRRLPRNKTPEQMDREREKRKLALLKGKMERATDALEKDDLDDQIEEINAKSETFDEYVEGTFPARLFGPTPYLKTKQPVYGYHEYEEWDAREIMASRQVGRMW